MGGPGSGPRAGGGKSAHDEIHRGGGRGPSDAISYTNARPIASVDVAFQRSEYRRQSAEFHKKHPEIET
jgi:hypothetical protein